MSKNTKNKTKTRELTSAISESTNESSHQDSKEKPVGEDHKSNDAIEYPLLGQPGGLDDPLRKGLSGAGIKWYLRYLAQGMPPPEARRKAEEHRNVSSAQQQQQPQPQQQQQQTEQRKRANVDSTASAAQQQQQQPIESKKFKSSTIDADATCSSKSIRVAVLAQAYPQIGLNANELATLEEALVDEMTKGWTSKLIFDGIAYRPGLLLIDCSNTETASWLQHIVGRLTNWPGAALHALHGSALPQSHTIGVHLPKSAGQSVDKTMALMYAQNDGIYTHLWELLSVHDDGDNNAQYVTLAIDDASYRTITQCNGNQLNYRFGRIAVQEVPNAGIK